MKYTHTENNIQMLDKQPGLIKTDKGDIWSKYLLQMTRRMFLCAESGASSTSQFLNENQRIPEVQYEWVQESSDNGPT